MNARVYKSPNPLVYIIKKILTVLNKILYTISFCFCVISASINCPEILADEGMQISVDGESFDPKNFFELKETGFSKD